MPVICSSKECNDPARCSIRTMRNDKTRDMKTIIYYDERTAPKVASPYCKQCAVHLVKELTLVLVDEE